MLTIHDGDKTVYECAQALNHEVAALCWSIHYRVVKGRRIRRGGSDPGFKPVMQTCYQVTQGGMGRNGILEASDVPEEVS